MILQSFSSEETIRIGEKIGSHLQKGDIIALQGFLAAGKTTITKGIALGLGIDEDVTSPTFTLISEYYGRLPLYHFDVYRLDSVEDFLNLGSEEMLYGDGVCVIEWSEKILDVFPEHTIYVRLEVNEDNSRSIHLENWTYGEIL
ncbi:MAG: tRNA (adenosine(37)-N6)-threonylcarbamoyltransferase complex ATPase subunit type 1 TsaE [Spirochaetota bacterium]|jgi:tRNA threonylcarbamoyladenosine biosynthesis protein TsaE|nr:tRNA (adenosine(37)-N6)-threonylcarbamoyltransferase complex ATPase subunit type 1 TsaE [Spirochaetota bacterium]NMA56027.1 tRNA (adenosine(37)-N6)-threonylcarbamoyltransferase complex ATPase subunit type 1 TsaE [Treponema sp.]